MSKKRQSTDTDNVRVLKQRIQKLEARVEKWKSDYYHQERTLEDTNDLLESRTVYLIKGDVAKFRKEYPHVRQFMKWDDKEKKYGDDTIVRRYNFYSADWAVFEWIREHFQTDESVKSIDFEVVY